MQDRPTTRELLRGVEHFLRNDAVSGLSGPSQFRARVAANVVAMVLRALATQEDHAHAEYAALAALLGVGEPPPDRTSQLEHAVRAMNETLAGRIRQGDADQGEFRRRAIAHLKRVAIDKLAVTNPTMCEAVRTEFGIEC